MDTIQVSIDLPREALSALRKEPKDFVQEMRIAAAVKWYETGIVSQAKAAEIAGLSRTEFISALNRFAVSPFQYDEKEIVKEAGNG